MPLTKPNQELRHDLKESTALFKWSGFKLVAMAMRQSGDRTEDRARARDDRAAI